MNSGISTGGSFIESEEISEYISQIARNLPGLRGPIGFQFKQSKEGKYSLLESNPRLQGTSVASLGLGYNFVEQALNISLNKNVDLPNKRTGIGFRRYYDEIFYSIG